MTLCRGAFELIPSECLCARLRANTSTIIHTNTHYKQHFERALLCVASVCVRFARRLLKQLRTETLCTKALSSSNNDDNDDDEFDCDEGKKAPLEIRTQTLCKSVCVCVFVCTKRIANSAQCAILPYALQRASLFISTAAATKICCCLPFSLSLARKLRPTKCKSLQYNLLLFTGRRDIRTRLRLERK